MRNRSSLLAYPFLCALCSFYMCVTQASEPSYYIIDDQWRKSDATLGSFIDSNPAYEKPILKNCLAYTIGKINNGVIPAVAPQAIAQFFEDQELIKYVRAPETIEEGKIKTFCHTYGVEFPHHGPLEERTITLIKTLAQQGSVTFLDIGACYGAFAKKVFDACAEHLDKITICLNDCLSVHCYHLAQSFKNRTNVLVYPCDILGCLNYYQMDRRFKISTIFNVHHFMKPNECERSIGNVYRITEIGGYHIAIALSPYHMGDSSILAREHDRRVAKDETNPGYFTDSDLVQMELILVRAPAFFPSKEVYERMFQDAGFFVEEAGYFSTNKAKPREFSYIIACKK